MAVTYKIKNWSMKWGIQPYGVNKWNPLEKLDSSKRGVKTPLRIKIEKEQNGLIEQANEDFGSNDIEIESLKGQPFHPSMDIEQYLEEKNVAVQAAVTIVISDGAYSYDACMEADTWLRQYGPVFYVFMAPNEGMMDSNVSQMQATLKNR